MVTITFESKRINHYTELHYSWNTLYAENVNSKLVSVFQNNIVKISGDNNSNLVKKLF